MIEYGELTKRQYQVFRYFRNYFVRNLDNPTVMEVADEFSMTPKGAWDCLNSIQKKGYLNKHNGNFRLHGFKVELKWS